MSKQAEYERLGKELMEVKKAEEVREIVARNIRTITPDFMSYLDSVISASANAPREDFKQMGKHMEWVKGTIDLALDSICIGDNSEVLQFVKKFRTATKEEIYNFLVKNHDQYGDVFLTKYAAYLGRIIERMSAQGSEGITESEPLQSILHEVRSFKSAARAERKGWLSRLLGQG